MDANQLNKELTGFAFYHLDGEDHKLTCSGLKCKLCLNKLGTFRNFINSFNSLPRLAGFCFVCAVVVFSLTKVLRKFKTKPKIYTLFAFRTHPSAKVLVMSRKEDKAENELLSRQALAVQSDFKDVHMSFKTTHLEKQSSCRITEKRCFSRLLNSGYEEKI